MAKAHMPCHILQFMDSILPGYTGLYPSVENGGHRLDFLAGKLF